MTEEQIRKARVEFREGYRNFGHSTLATVMDAWDRGFADALKIVTDEMREMRVNLERRQGYDGRRG